MFLVAPLVLSLHCATSKSAGPKAASGAPAAEATSEQSDKFQRELDALMKREAELSNTVAVTSDDKKISLRVASTGKPTLTKSADESYSLLIPVGVDEPIRCEI